MSDDPYPSGTDPRLTDEYVRRIPAADGGPVTLVGVVHDHPASMFRVRRVVAETEPDALALELPSLALPLFVEYAREGEESPPFGGEMSEAIRAAETDRVAGIDGPSVGFAARLARRTARESPSSETARSVVRSLWSATKHAAVCRVAAVVRRTTGVRVAVGGSIDHGCAATEEAAAQAADEREQVRRSRTIMNAFRSSGASAVRRATREEYMARRVERLSREGSVTAVVGIGHLDPLAAALDGR